MTVKKPVTGTTTKTATKTTTTSATTESFEDFYREAKEKVLNTCWAAKIQRLDKLDPKDVAKMMEKAEGDVESYLMAANLIGRWVRRTYPEFKLSEVGIRKHRNGECRCPK